jgi:hypothetical protein
MPTAESRRILSEITLSRQPENTQPAVFGPRWEYKMQMKKREEEKPEGRGRKRENQKTEDERLKAGINFPASLHFRPML